MEHGRRDQGAQGRNCKNTLIFSVLVVLQASGQSLIAFMPMKFVGIDLAWSEHHPSGIAVIDSDGTLVRASGDIRSNNDLCEFAGLADGDAIVAIDAPLIVKNATK